jgi:Flp pilus assembly protein TadG
MSRRPRGGPRRESGPHPDGGTATAFVVFLAAALLALAGLVVDGGLALNARQQVADDAEQAARAGAQRVDLLTLRQTGQVLIEGPAAESSAAAFLATRGYPAGDTAVVASQTQVTVRARRTVPTALLSLVFIDSFTVEASARARAAVGITAEVP